MNKRVQFILIFILASCSFLLINNSTVFSDNSNVDIEFIIHEENDSSEVKGNRSISVYDMTSIYLEEQKNPEFSDKSFSEEWSNKVLKTDEGLPRAIRTGITDDKGNWSFTAPLYSEGNFAVYLIKENTKSNPLIIIPSVIILPLYSTDNSEMLTTIDVYPKYIEGVVPEEPTKPTEPKKPTGSTKNKSSSGRLPSTNEIKTSTLWIGISIIAFICAVFTIKNKKEKLK